MKNSKIEWTQDTWNPLRGCSRVSDGCRNCYAEQVAGRFSGAGQPYEGLITKTAKGPTWNGQIKLVPEKLEEPLRWTKPRKIFVNSMSDLFHENVPDEYIDKVFAVMALAPRHTFQVLTKRPERMKAYLGMDNRAEAIGWAETAIYETYGRLPIGAYHGPTHRKLPLPNVWLGVSVENQATADGRIPLLLQTPAAVRWISAEPLLGPVDLTKFTLPNWKHERDCEYVANDMPAPCTCRASQGGLDWVVAGGESGRNARPTHPQWARTLRDQCKEAGVAFLFKQWGEYGSVYDRQKDDPDWRRCGDIEANNQPGRWLNLAGGHGFHGDSVHFVKKLGKKTAGRELDGRTWDEYPQ
jgi:protein gp37